jgi:hypothetical protein
MSKWDKDYYPYNRISSHRDDKFNFNNPHTSSLKNNNYVMRSDDAAWQGFLPASYKYGPVFSVYVKKTKQQLVVD